MIRPGYFLPVTVILCLCAIHTPAVAQDSKRPAAQFDIPSLPDELLVETYQHAARDNVLAAVIPDVFPGYFSVCADGQGFGYGNSYPSLDGHQMSAALLWLGQESVVRANWDYVRGFQQPSGRLPLAILPALAGQRIGPETAQATVDANGGLYEHWVPGNPLAALASPTFIQNADVIYRHTLDRQWLENQLGAVNLAADYLAGLITQEGMVEGAGYYVERPTRISADGVSQCHAVDAFRRVAALNRVLKRGAAAARYAQLAERVRDHFVSEFWQEDHFAEYRDPTRGYIASHGLTDVDWAALATDVATAAQQQLLWPRLSTDTAFYYGGMPTGISTRPASYEDWEFAHPDRHDLAAMGRVWYLECWARSRQDDARGLLDTLHRVAREGQTHDYSWRERYYPSDTGQTVPAGAERYCEYPANFLRIVNQFLLGINLQMDGAVLLDPCVVDEFWDRGFGHVLRRPEGELAFQLQRNRIEVSWCGPQEQTLGVRVPAADQKEAEWKTTTPDAASTWRVDRDTLWLTLPPSSVQAPWRVVIAR